MPGTEVGSPELRRMHQAYAVARAEQAARKEEIAALKTAIEMGMAAEGVECLVSEIEVGAETRRYRTTRELVARLRSELSGTKPSGDA